jgi:hypothetical protein
MNTICNQENYVDGAAAVCKKKDDGFVNFCKVSNGSSLMEQPKFRLWHGKEMYLQIRESQADNRSITMTFIYRTYLQDRKVQYTVFPR